MAKTGIEWATDVWNPTTGCTKVSAGCKHCYAEKMHARLTAMGQPKYAEPFSIVRTHESALNIPLHWKKPRRIFVNSMSDLFHKDVPFYFINRVFAVMVLCPQHQFLVLTKRAERMLEYASHLLDAGIGRILPILGNHDRNAPVRFPLPNVRLGVSIENQETADKRLGPLCELATVGWKTMVSAEPLLGPIEMSSHLGVWRCSGCGEIKDQSPQWRWTGSGWEHKCSTNHPQHGHEIARRFGGVGWLITGCESGTRARQSNDDWFRGLRDQALLEGVPFFLKQKMVDGKLVKLPYLDGREHRETPE